MSAQSGRDMLVKLVQSDGSKLTLGGLRSKALILNARSVDITDSESPHQWRELLPGGAVKSVEVSGSGIFRNAQSDAIARQAFFDQSLLSLSIMLPGFGEMQGPFQLSALRYSGQYDGEAAYELTLASAGEITFELI